MRRLDAIHAGGRGYHEPARILGEINGKKEEGPYHRYLESLSPDFDHLLAYSRYDYFKTAGYRFRSGTANSFIPSFVSFSSIYVIDILKYGRALEPQLFNGVDSSSMDELRALLSNESTSDHDVQYRIIYTQYLTAFSIEALGSALSLDPNVLSYYIGNMWKDCGKETAYCEKCPKLLKYHPPPFVEPLGYYVGHNMGYAKDNAAHDSLAHSIYSTQAQPTTFSVSIPRTVYVGDRDTKNDNVRDIGFQEPGLLYHLLGRFRPPAIFEEFENLQHATIHVEGESRKKSYRQVLVLLPPSHCANTPPRLDPVSGKKVTKSFDEFLQSGGRNEQNSQYDTFVNDIVSLARSKAEFKLAHIAHIVRCYALHEWFDLIQRLEGQLEDITISRSVGRSCRGEDKEHALKRCPELNLMTDEEGMKNAILRYMPALDEEIERLNLDMDAATTSGNGDSEASSHLAETAKKYTYIQRLMGRLLPRVQHSIDVKNVEKNRDLTNLQIMESRKSIEQAETIKRLTTLAFIYIPLSFVSSAFGMNVREMDPQPSIWIFIVIAVVVTLITVAIAMYARVVRYLRLISEFLAQGLISLANLLPTILFGCVVAKDKIVDLVHSRTRDI